jgi:hypothetical protein
MNKQELLRDIYSLWQFYPELRLNQMILSLIEEDEMEDVYQLPDTYLHSRIKRQLRICQTETKGL